METEVPFPEWLTYIVDLGAYLNSVMKSKEDGYHIVRQHFTVQDVPSMSHADATVFIDTHFTQESSRLRTDLEKYQLLERATNQKSVFHSVDGIHLLRVVWTVPPSVEWSYQ